MSIWDDISNGFGNAVNTAESGLSSLGSSIGSGLGGLSNFVLGSDTNSVNGVRPFGDLNILGKLAEGIQGPAEINRYNQNYNLQKLGSSLANGDIDQGQYLKSMAQYSPETYNKMLLAQVQATPAAVKTFNDIQSLVQQGDDAQTQGNVDLARQFYEKADNLNGIARPALIGTKTYVSRLLDKSAPANGAPTQNSNAVTTGRYAPLMNDNAVTSAPLPPLPGAVPSNNPAVSPQPMPANEVLNNTAGMTDAEKVAAKLPNTPTSPIPQPPMRQPGQTELQYKNDVKRWEDANAAYLSEQKSSGGDTNKYDEDVTNRAQVSSKMIQLITEMRDAQQNFKSGALAPAQATLLKWGRALGADLSPDEVASLSNQQAFNKWTNTLIGQAAKAEGGASRLQAAYNGIVGANPNASLEPETLNKLFDTMGTTANQDIIEQRAWAQQKAANPSLTAAQFRRQYNSEHNTEQEKAGGNLPGYAGNTQNNNGLPQGTVANPDGTFKLPNGKIVRKKQ